MHHPGAIDGGEGDADAEVSPGEADHHVLGESGRVAEFDAHLGGLSCKRWVGVYSDLPFCVRRVREGVQRDGWAEDLPDSANDPGAFLSINKGSDVQDWCIIWREWSISRCGDRHHDRTLYSRFHIQQNGWLNFHLPAGY